MVNVLCKVPVQPNRASYTTAHIYTYNNVTHIASYSYNVHIAMLKDVNCGVHIYVAS